MNEEETTTNKQYKCRCIYSLIDSTRYDIAYGHKLVVHEECVKADNRKHVVGEELDSQQERRLNVADAGPYTSLDVKFGFRQGHRSARSTPRVYPGRRGRAQSAY
eukprot:GHVU01119786.1.p2 GENE.GHVU01119786.1~~GHVU01119786.1.p2  ORF type:complete len:105 (-),score=4.93 GHVU01119786.1:953-1267(-)